MVWPIRSLSPWLPRISIVRRLQSPSSLDRLGAPNSSRSICHDLLESVAVASLRVGRTPVTCAGDRLLHFANQRLERQVSVYPQRSVLTQTSRSPRRKFTKNISRKLSVLRFSALRSFICESETFCFQFQRTRRQLLSFQFLTSCAGWRCRAYSWHP